MSQTETEGSGMCSTQVDISEFNTPCLTDHWQSAKNASSFRHLATLGLPILLPSSYGHSCSSHLKEIITCKLDKNKLRVHKEENSTGQAAQEKARKHIQ